MKRMRQTTAVSFVALGAMMAPANAQQQGGFYNDPAFVQPFQGQQPFPAQQPFQPQFQPQVQPQFQQQQPFTNQPLYVDPNTGIVMPQPPGGVQQFPNPRAGTAPQPQATFPEALPRPEATPFAPDPQQGFAPSVQPQPQPNFAPLPGNPSVTPAVQPVPEAPSGTTPYYDDSAVNGSATPVDPPNGSTSTSASDGFDAAASGVVSGADRAPTMAAELDELLRVGERYRAASPGFLEDLKGLAAKYRDPLPAAAGANLLPPVSAEASVDLAGTDPGLIEGGQQPALIEQGIDTMTPSGPVQSAVDVPPLDPGSISFAYLEDYFTDGELDNNPPWRMRQGEWYIDPTYGLRARQPNEASNTPIRPKEVLKSLLTGDTPEVSETSAQPRAALIETPTSIGNAFSFAARIVDHAGTGTAHFILHQGGANWLGYRLELRSGPQPVVVLTRRGSNGYKDITKVAIPGFTTGKEHELRWARLSDGQMLVLLDGRPVITSRDTVFREDWTGFAFFNAGGDVSIRALRIAAPVER